MKFNNYVEISLVWFGLVAMAQVQLDPRHPWFCTILDVSESNGLKVYDIKKIPGTRKFMLPFYEVGSFGTSGAYIYDLSSGNISFVVPSTSLANLRSIRINSSVLHSLSKWYGAGFSRFEQLGNQTFRLAILGFDFIKSGGTYMLFDLPNFLRDSLIALPTGVSISQRNVLFGGYFKGPSYTYSGLIVKFNPVSKTAMGKILNIVNGDILIQNVYRIDSAYLLITAIGRENNNLKWRVINMIVDTGITTIVDTFSFEVQSYPVIEITDVDITWRNACEKQVYAVGFICKTELEFRCGTTGEGCYGVLGSYGIEKIPDNSLPSGYRWQFTKMHWLRRFYLPNLAGLKHMGFLYGIRVINTYQKREATLVGWFNYKCVLSDSRWAGWIIRVSLDSGKIVDNWRYMAKGDVFESCLPGEKAPAGIMLTAIDDSTGLIGGTIMRWLASYTQKEECFYTRDAIVLREGVFRTFPPSKPNCCEVSKGVSTSLIAWQKVKSPSLIINPVVFSYYSSIPAQVSPKTVNCTGVGWDKVKNVPPAQ